MQMKCEGCAESAGLKRARQMLQKVEALASANTKRARVARAPCRQFNHANIGIKVKTYKSMKELHSFHSM